MERNIFWTLKPEPGENLEKLMLRAREQAYKCNFGTNQQESRDVCVIDKITLLAPHDLREKLLQKDQLTLDDVFKIVASHQSVKYQASQMEQAGPSEQSQTMITGEVNRLYTPPSNRDQECSRCGRRGHLANDKICPACDKPCNQCKRIGHFYKKCKAFQARSTYHISTSHKPVKPTFQRIRAVPVDGQGLSEETKKDDEELQSFIFSIGDGDEFIWLKVGGVMMQALIDSGCNKDIIDDVTWDRLKLQGIAIQNATKQVDHKFRGYGKDCKPMDVVGMFDATVAVNGVDHQTNGEARFYVIKGGNQPLLGKETARELNVLRLRPPILENGVFKLATQKCSWNHIVGMKNPADCISLGISVDTVIDYDLWWQGSERFRQRLENHLISTNTSDQPYLHVDRSCPIHVTKTILFIESAHCTCWKQTLSS
ncbi:uncharacterized protein LOC129720620 [Wyeomyia smithii]|uniref:uncharacterized protein LOC129720620 n=1 Tax=Wyeomyia smithii TaxID=174621 RepID=UPI002467CFED|nr:uncharacterized protein LOC129720620 [Wyeomyia smithii]